MITPAHRYLRHCQTSRSTPYHLMLRFAPFMIYLCLLLAGSHALLAAPALQTVPAVSFNPVPGWSSNNNDETYSIAWGDMNGDGTLDLAVGNDGKYGGQPTKVYLNQGGVLQATPAWSAP